MGAAGARRGGTHDPLTAPWGTRGGQGATPPKGRGPKAGPGTHPSPGTSRSLRPRARSCLARPPPPAEGLGALLRPAGRALAACLRDIPAPCLRRRRRRRRSRADGRLMAAASYGRAELRSRGGPGGAAAAQRQRAGRGGPRFGEGYSSSQGCHGPETPARSPPAASSSRGWLLKGWRTARASSESLGEVGARRRSAFVLIARCSTRGSAEG